MVTAEQIRWSGYDVYEGPFYIGAAKFAMPPKPTMDDYILATITATEGGSWNAINMYDRCICTVGLIQWCEAGQYSVSDMIGAAFSADKSLLSPLVPMMVKAQVTLQKNAKGRWRFFFADQRGEVDRIDEQRQMWLLNSSGKKGEWDAASRAFAKDWAAALATTFEQPGAIEAQKAFTVPRLYWFATPFAQSWIQSAQRQSSNPNALAFICAYLSFAANNPARADASLKEGTQKAHSLPVFSRDWMSTVLERLTFASGVTIYPHRYNAIRPVLEKLFGIDLPDYAESLRGLLDPKEIQSILVHQLKYDLGTSGPNHDGVDGSWGNKSRTALADFERRNGLNPDGMPDAATNAALIKVRDAG